MANSVTHARLPYPIRKGRYTVAVNFFTTAGAAADPTSPDTEVSIDAGAFADAAEEVTTITGSNGVGYVTLTGAEMDGSLIAVALKTSNCMPSYLFLQPQDLPTIASGTLTAGAAGGGTLTATGFNLVGCFIRTTGGTGGGGTGGANNQVRRIQTYTNSTGGFTVVPNWETTVDGTTTYDLLLPNGMTLGSLKALNPATDGRTINVDASGLVTTIGGTITLTQVTSTLTLLANNAITAGAFAAACTSSALLGVNLINIAGAAVNTSLAQLGVNVVTNGDKTGYSITSGTLTLLAANAITSTSFAAACTSSALLGVNLINIAGVAVDTSLAQIGVNLVKAGGSNINQTAGTLNVNTMKWNGQLVNQTVNGFPAVDVQYANGIAITLDTNNTMNVSVKYVGGTAQTAGDIYGTLNTRLSSARAGYLDNLNIGGAVASAAAVLNIQNNTFIASDVPQILERPDAGSETVPMTFIFADTTGAAKDLDSGNPTLTLVDNAGTDLSSRLAGSGATWTHVGTGEYKIDYTNSSGDGIAELRWKITGTINGVARKMVFRTQIADTTAVDFTSSDRTTLQAIAGYVDTEVAAIKAKTDNLPSDPADASDIASAFTSVNNALTTIAGYIDTEVAAIKSKTDNLPSQPAAVSDIPTVAQITAQITNDHGTGSYLRNTEPDNTNIGVAATQAAAAAANAATAATNTTQLPNMIQDPGASAKFKATALSLAPAGGGGGGATADEVAAAVDTLLSDNHGAGNWEGQAEGDGSIAVNHNTGGTDALRFVHSGQGVANAVIRAYLKSEYDTGIRTVRGESRTGDDGRWVADMMLNALTYTITFDAEGYKLKTAEVTVVA